MQYIKKVIFLFILLFPAVIVYGQDGCDSFSIPWPNEYNWKVYNKVTGVELAKINTENYDWMDFELIPGTETLDNWTIFCSVSVYKRTSDKRDINYESVINNKISEIKNSSPKATITLLEKGDNWSLFKMESITSIHKNPESELCYIMRGGWGRIYVANVIVKKVLLDNDFIIAWKKVFESRKYMYW